MSLTRLNALTTRYSGQTTSVRASGRQLIGWIFADTTALPLKCPSKVFEIIVFRGLPVPLIRIPTGS